MAICLGIDTGGTFTDAVLLDDAQAAILAQAKALTTRPDPFGGIRAAVDAVLAASPGVGPASIALVGLSTTLATNALVEGRGERAALVAIGLEPAELARAGLAEALRGDPLIAVAGGHDHAGTARAALDEAALAAGLDALPPGIAAVAVVGAFATRNPGHEARARDLIRARTGLPVTCSHELAAGLGAPRRALTALLNARLIGLVDRLVAACQAHLGARGIAAPLMVVRGDGALVAAGLVRERPIETILSGPAASLAGARWLTGLSEALVSDIGGTTTDMGRLAGGRPVLDPDGARVGGFRTLVRAVAMRTTGLGGDSAVRVGPGLTGALILGPRRVMPVALAGHLFPGPVAAMLEGASSQPVPVDGAARLIVPLGAPPPGLDARAAALARRLADEGPMPQSALVRQRIDLPALDRLVAAGGAIPADVTPTDALHVLGLQTGWDAGAALGALALMARSRRGDGQPLAADAAALAQAIRAAMTAQTCAAVLEAVADEALGRAATDTDLGLLAGMLAPRPGAGLTLSARLALPLVGLGASAGCHYGPVAERLGCALVVPAAAGVANAVGAVVGQVEVTAEGTITCPGPGTFLAHLPEGPARFAELGPARARLRAGLEAEVRARAGRAGLDAPALAWAEDLVSAEIEGQRVVIEAQLRVTASGRPGVS